MDRYSRQLRRDILEWDVSTWYAAIRFWNRVVVIEKRANVLEIGARNGGLSLFFALKGCHVVCSDRDGPSPRAHELHRRNGIADHVTYRAYDATDLSAPDNYFDIVCFKSVLGGIGGVSGLDGQQCAVGEMHRVLKPGGKLLFAENLRGSSLHQWLRRRFIAWEAKWRYIDFAEVPPLFRDYRDLKLAYRGFFAVFGRSEFQRSVLHTVDVITMPLIRKQYRYLVMGCAIK